MGNDSTMHIGIKSGKILLPIFFGLKNEFKILETFYSNAQYDFISYVLENILTELF